MERRRRERRRARRARAPAAAAAAAPSPPRPGSRALADWASVGCGSRRAVADVSADADPYTGVAVYDSTETEGNKGWATIGGTSVASPIIASVFALAGGAHGVAYPARTLYENARQSPASLHDVTVGSNGECRKPFEKGHRDIGLHDRRRGRRPAPPRRSASPAAATTGPPASARPTASSRSLRPGPSPAPPKKPANRRRAAAPLRRARSRRPARARRRSAARRRSPRRRERRSSRR